MSKIIRAINVMISNSDKISRVISSTTTPEQAEYFFVYDQKHKWSISLGHDGVYFLHYYSGPESIEALASFDPEKWSFYDKFVTYSSKELKTREAYESLQELYRVIQEKLYRVHEALDDIIESDDSF